ncbi:MAG: hypothetical protein Q8920_04415 [Bacillota bacterium]|nr:hypothetical protein [Bacillota bacterium]
MDKLKVIEAKRLRALLIKALYDAFPGSILKGTLKRAFVDSYTNNEVDKAIEYLKDIRKQYIEVTDTEEANDDDTLIKLTAIGNDLMEGTIDDLGVGF